MPKSSLSASYSTLFQPTPTPSLSRLPDRIATSAACLATSTVWRCGRITTAVTSSTSVRAGGEEPEQHERLVEGDVLVVGALEPARPITIGADHVVVDQQMAEAELLRTFGVGADRTGSLPIS